MSFDLSNLCITRICSVYNINAKSKKRISRNDRRICALSFKLAGKTEYFCDQKTYVCDPNNVLLLPKNKPYSYEILELGQCISIEFESDTDIDDFYCFNIADNTEIRKLLYSIAHIWKTKSGGYMLSLLSLVYELLYVLYLAANVDYSMRKKETALAPVLTYLSEHYADSDITNEKLAHIADMSTVYFRKVFTSRYGISPMKYLTNIRIETAKNLLLGGNMSVSDIGYAIGFSSVYSFSRAFKKQTGISPTEFVQTRMYFPF